jgi:hypothetical protein
VATVISPADLERAVYQALTELPRDPAPSGRPVWSVPSLRGDEVGRPEPMEALVAAVLAADAAAVGVTTGLVGAGGFGKTTLARMVAHDPRVRAEFGGGTVWVTVGEDAAGPDLAHKLVSAARLFDPAAPEVTDPIAAGGVLGRTLDGRRVLLVVDDVWTSGQVEPFLVGGEGAVRLFTTRQQGILPDSAARVAVDGPGSRPAGCSSGSTTSDCSPATGASPTGSCCTTSSAPTCGTAPAHGGPSGTPPWSTRTGREAEPQPRVLHRAAGLEKGRRRLGVRAEGRAVDVQQDAADRVPVPVVDTTTGPHTDPRCGNGRPRPATRRTRVPRVHSRTPVLPANSAVPRMRGRLDFSLFCFTFHDHQARIEHVFDSLSVRERELLDAIASAQVAENAAAARKAEVVREFALARASSLTSVGDVEPERVERKIVAEVAVACRVSPFQGRRRLHLARDLHLGLDHVRTLYGAGELSEDTVLQVVAATAHLDPTERAAVDARLAAESVERLGVRRVHDRTRTLATEIAPEKALLTTRTAQSGRHIRVRLATDGMADLVAHLPAEQAAACFGALHRAVNEHYVTAESVTRTRGQILADTLVERLTGQTTAGDVNVEVQVLMPVETLLDPNSPLPAQVAGHGPIPADIARELLATTAGKKSLRRLVTRDGIVIGGDSRRRNFDGALETFIRARDGNRCTAPYCDAPIKHIDHMNRWADGGRTEFTNGRGYCEFHNYVREPLPPAPCTPPSPRSRTKAAAGSTRPPSRSGASRPGRTRPAPVG